MKALGWTLLAPALVTVLQACTPTGPAAPPLLGSSRFLGPAAPRTGASAPARSTAFDRSADNRPAVGYADIAVTGSVAPVGATGRRAALSEDGQRFEINFVDVDVQEFIRVVFDEVLHENVVVDPAVSGRVTVRTAAPVSRRAALDLIRSVLAGTGATIVETDGVFRVASGQSDGRGAVLGAQPMRVFPLRFIDAEQARSALQPFGGDNARIASLPGGAAIVVAAPEADLERFEQVLATLDVDRMRGRSFVLMPLEEAGAAAVATELNGMFGSEGKGSFKALPIERMNAVLLLGQSEGTVTRAAQWVRRLDQAGADERRVYVYPVRNRRASELATVLQGIVGGGADGAAGAVVAPGATPVTASAGEAQATPASGDMTPSSSGAGDAAPEPASGETPPAAGGAATAEAPADDDAVAIRADPATNALVIIAKAEDYAIVERAIQRLDVMPTQVLIEATIAEVTLNDTLRHGVRWFFESGNHGFLLSDEEGRAMGGILPGFNYAFRVPHARVVIDALEGMTDVEIVSSPALTVLDNQTATLKVGDQVPIATRAARSVEDVDAPVVNDIEMKDTGVILSVRPRVNAEGLVQLDISQEISDVVPTTTSSIDSPTIRQRAITSSIVVQSGTEIVLGGMISTRREKSDTGVPLLKDIPLLGAAFTTNATGETGRTELLIIIRPVVMASNSDVQAITSEISSRIHGIAP